MILARCITLALACATLPALAGDWNAHIRYRHEAVDDDAFTRDARADTARLRLGWSHAFAHGFSAGADLEAIAELGDDFNSGANGRTAYPAVPDARAFELNQAWLRWAGERGDAVLGRLRLVFDNQRFIGNSGWRQNEQTFDAVAFDFTAREGVTLRYAWLGRVHRPAGDNARDPLARERRLDTHLANASWAGTAGTLVGYGYWLDDRDVASASTRTLGLRWTRQTPAAGTGFGWSLETARQRPHADNPRDVDAAYFLVEPTLTLHGLTWKLGWEQLGGDGVNAFQTPLATLHAFNGWADKFVVTPVDGLDDRYAAVSGKLGRGRLQDKLAWTIAWHDFHADHGGADYGREWDASLAFPLPKGLSGLVKLADYQSDGFARDTRKLWLQVEWSH
ncbi:alginate export family protein [Arenimonas daejeonensis]|uniref:alginate export family protein n=1 Tax=Arenimonas daejeonensis TaxID=370777 RepID=UPI0011BE007D|nr:alginate export family protein [Arenimonas daejeonensis]